MIAWVRTRRVERSRPIHYSSLRGVDEVRGIALGQWAGPVVMERVLRAYRAVENSANPFYLFSSYGGAVRCECDTRRRDACRDEPGADGDDEQRHQRDRRGDGQEHRYLMTVQCTLCVIWCVCEAGPLRPAWVLLVGLAAGVGIVLVDRRVV